MSITRSPPVKFGSQPDLNRQFRDTAEDDFVSTRKRKKPDDDIEMLICRKFDLLESKWDDWSSRMNKFIADSIAETVKTSITDELTKITCMMSSMNTSLEKLSLDNTIIRESLSDIQARVTVLEESASFSSEQFNELKGRVEVVEKHVPITSSITDQMVVLQHKLDIMEQQARECNIEISNLPERRNENLLTLVEQLGTVIKVPITAAQITSVHRVPHASQTSSRPRNVIVKLTSRLLRDNVVAGSRFMKGRLTTEQLSIQGTVHNIYINEHLTLQNKLLFRAVREEAKKKQYKYCWVKHGVILVRRMDAAPIQAIRNMQEISKIK
ncbi:unnamed protein product [Euphydryas editha]|uniref:FP protein C-terminal domain-containing protein n=1 Tax=Euphydryas editha TaxID=104508 RepID=A0AAU9UCC5_EUPED|nr:unnamed protein product [Euphydryas editha]